MYQAFPDFFQQLHSIVMNQETRIHALEKTIKDLERQLSEMKQRPTLHVDKIEYKFDQLKVETLDGTLNIGLNPSDLQQNIEDFAVQNGAIPTPMMDPKHQFQRSIELEDEIYQYLETDLPTLVQQTAEKMDRKLEENYLEFIKEDIKKQVPARVQYYLQQMPIRSDSQDVEARRRQIFSQLIREMENGVRTFITNLPNNMNGG
jgi:spore germination protein PC